MCVSLNDAIAMIIAAAGACIGLGYGAVVITRYEREVTALRRALNYSREGN